MHDYESGATIFVAIIFIIAAIVIWFLLRELVCWYYKINEMKKNQEKIIELLSSIDKKMKGDGEVESSKGQGARLSVKVDPPTTY